MRNEHAVADPGQDEEGEGVDRSQQIEIGDELL